MQQLHAAIQELYTEHSQPLKTEEVCLSDVTSDSKEQENHKEEEENHTENEKEIVRDGDISMEEPSETESTDITKASDDKGSSAITTTAAVHTSPRMTVSITSPEQRSPKKAPQSKGRFGFLEKLGSGSHSMAIFDDDKRSRSPTKETNAMQDDVIKMESIPDLSPSNPEGENSVSSDIKSNNVSPSEDPEKNKPSRSQSDVELAQSCYIPNEVMAKQEYCVKDPFQLPSEIHQEIGEMALMCFEMRVYGKLRKDSVTTTHDHTESSTKPMFEVGEQTKLEDIDKDSAIQTGSPFCVPTHASPSTTTAHEQPESDIQVDTEDAMETDVDKVAAVFIKEYFHFLDVVKLREVLSLREDHRELSFQAIIRCLQGKPP